MMSKLFVRQLFLLMVVCLLFGGCDKAENSQSSQPNAPVGLIGKKAPDLILRDLDGQARHLSQYEGQVVILNFWATWCPPCREEMPSMEALHQKFGEQGLVVLAVNVEENGAEAVAAFLEQYPYTFPIILDPMMEAQQAYGVFRYPESFVIDRNGVIVKKILGARDWMSGSTYQLIDLLING
jgi:peroxiredoxin